VAVLLLALGLATGWHGAAWASVGLLGAGYSGVLALEDEPLDGRAAVVAAGLLLVAELASWSLDARAAVTEEPGAPLAQLAFLLALAGGALLLGAGLLALVDLAARDGLAFEAAGALAAAAALGLLLVAARREGS
jgi:hypothetical protein